MTVAYIFMMAAACLLAAMAIESLLRSLNALNFAASLVLLSASVFTLCLGLTDYFNLLGSRTLALLILKIRFASLPLAGYAFFLFSTNFPRGLKSETPLKLHWFVLVLSAAFASSSVFAESYLHYALLIYTLLIYSFSLFLIVYKYGKSLLIYQKKQIRYFLSGFIFFILVQFFLYFFGGTLQQAIKNSVSAFAFITAGGALLYSIIVYRFINLRNRLLILLRNFLIGIIVSMPIIILIYTFRIWLDQAKFSYYFLIMIPSLVLFFWLYDLTGNLIRKILKINYMTQDMTEIFLDNIVKSLSLFELAKNTINALTDNINCRYADFLLFDREKDLFNVLYSSNGNNYTISAIEPFFRYVNEKTDIYDREQINFDPRFNLIKDSAERYFKKHEASLLVPFYYENALIAIIPISGKFNNTSYTSHELALISKLKKISQIVLNNIILLDKEQEAKVTKRDLILASNIQEAIFQSVIPSFTSIDAFALQIPARGVSGDYFMIEKTSNNSLGTLIADVSGKGFSAALVSMIIHTITRSQEFSSTSTNAIVSKINDMMTSSQNYSSITKTMSFATVFCGFFDNDIQTMFYTNAGHHPIIVYDMKSKNFDFVKANGKPVGIFPEETYLSRSYHYEKGKIFVLYSDGITEALNSSEEEFGQERLLAIIKQSDNKTSRETADEIIQAVENFADSYENLDDMTLIVIKL